jgi:REP element-mobilizing transposase RayT
MFGEVINNSMVLNNLGEVIADEWRKSSDIRQEIRLDAWIVMPNHFHGIVGISNSASETVVNGSHHRDAAMTDDSLLKGISMKPRSLSSLVSGFKAATTRRINIIRDAPGTPAWQRNYYEHIIRNKVELQYIREYIWKNPSRWDVDQLHPNSQSKW